MKKLSTLYIFGLMASLSMLDANADVRSACAEDVKTLCPGMKIGGGRIAACLKENKDKVSSPCKSALTEKAKELESKKT
jgi:hypothetical protein